MPDEPSSLSEEELEGLSEPPPYIITPGINYTVDETFESVLPQDGNSTFSMEDLPLDGD